MLPNRVHVKKVRKNSNFASLDVFMIAVNRDDGEFLFPEVVPLQAFASFFVRQQIPSNKSRTSNKIRGRVTSSFGRVCLMLELH